MVLGFDLGLDLGGDALEGAEREVDVGGDRRGEKVADAARREEAADLCKGFGRGFHYVVIDGAVDMDVEKSRGEDGLVGAYGSFVDRDDAAFVINRDDGIEPCLCPGMQTGGEECVLHRFSVEDAYTWGGGVRGCRI